MREEIDQAWRDSARVTETPCGCGSVHVLDGYGVVMDDMGAYAACLDCGTIREFTPDKESNVTALPPEREWRVRCTDCGCVTDQTARTSGRAKTLARAAFESAGLTDCSHFMGAMRCEEVTP